MLETRTSPPAANFLELLPFSSITADDLIRTGEPDLETLRRRAAHSGPIRGDTFVYRVEFHVVGSSASTRPLGDRCPLPDAGSAAFCMIDLSEAAIDLDGHDLAVRGGVVVAAAERAG